jgi:hypothetical protein
MEPRRKLWQSDEDAQKEYSFELVGINRKIGFPRRRCAMVNEPVDENANLFCRDTIENFAFMGLSAKANLKNPQVTYMVYEECTSIFRE